MTRAMIGTWLGVLSLGVAGCMSSGTPEFEGSARAVEACDTDCRLTVTNWEGQSVMISVYQGAGHRRFLGTVQGGSSETFAVTRNLTSDRIVVVAELGRRVLCRGAIDLPSDRPARFTVGNPTECRLEG